MSAVSGYYTFLSDFVNFKENITLKIPERIWNNSINVYIKKNDCFCFESIDKGIRKCESWISAREMLDTIGALFNIKFSYSTSLDVLNPIDKDFRQLLERSGSLINCSEVKSHWSSLQAAEDDLVSYSRKCIESIYEKRRSKEVVACTAMSKFIKQSIQADDGADLDYYVYGDAKKTPLILVNAYGIGVDIWKYIIGCFGQSFRIITWEIPGPSFEATQSFIKGSDHAKSLQSIISNEKIDRADFICWCSGLKVLMEYYHRRPDVFKTISIICGYFNPLENGRSLETEFDLAIGGLSRLLVNNPVITTNPYIEKLVKKLFNFDYNEKTLFDINDSRVHKSLSLVLSSAVPEVKEIITRPFNSKKTLINYAYLTIDLQEHNITNILPKIDVPALVINAGRDIISNPESAMIAHQKIKNCEYVFLENSTHWCLWDDNEKVNEILEKFLQRNCL